MKNEFFVFYTARIYDKFLSPQTVAGSKLLSIKDINDNISRVSRRKTVQSNSFEKLYNALISNFISSNEIKKDSYIFHHTEKLEKKYEKKNHLFFLNFLHCLYILRRNDEKIFLDKFKHLKILKYKKEKENLFVEERSIFSYLDFFKRVIEKHLCLPYFLDTYNISSMDYLFDFVSYMNLISLKKNIVYFSPSQDDLKHLQILLTKSRKKEFDNDFFSEMFKRNMYISLILNDFLLENFDFNYSYGVIYYVYDVPNENKISEIINNYQNIVSCDKNNNQMILIHKNNVHKNHCSFSFNIMIKDNSNLIEFMKSIGIFKPGYAISNENDGTKHVVISSLYDLIFTKDILKIFQL